MNYRITKILTGKRSVFPLLFILLIPYYGCGDKAGKTEDPVSESGALQLRLNWNPKPVETPGSRALTASPSGDVCIDYDIETIHATLANADGDEVASDDWECAAHGGRLEDIKTGSGYKVAVDGMIDSEACWRGEALEVEVVKDRPTPVEIAMYYVSCSRDLPPPAIASVSPGEDAVGVPTNARIRATFANPMVAASILAESAFTLSAGQVAVDGDVEYDQTARTATFTPRSALAPNTVFTARISSSVEDKNGHSMPAAYTWTFTSGDVSVLSWGEGEWGNAVWGGD